MSNPQPMNMELSNATREYVIDGKTFVVKPVFKEKASESVTSILVKLINSENGHKPQSL